MATALWPWRGRGEGPVALDTFFHFNMLSLRHLTHFLSKFQLSFCYKFSKIAGINVFICQSAKCQWTSCLPRRPQKKNITEIHLGEPIKLLHRRRKQLRWIYFLVTPQQIITKGWKKRSKKCWCLRSLWGENETDHSRLPHTAAGGLLMHFQPLSRSIILQPEFVNSKVWKMKTSKRLNNQG